MENTPKTEISPVDPSWGPPQGKRFDSDFVPGLESEHRRDREIPTAGEAGRVACQVIELPPDWAEYKKSHEGHKSTKDTAKVMKPNYLAGDELRQLQEKNTQFNKRGIWFNGQILSEYSDIPHIRNEYIENVRKDLKEAGAKNEVYMQIAQSSNDGLILWTEEFMKIKKNEQTAKRIEFEKVKAEFTAQIYDAINTKGLPLTKEQVDQRLQGIEFASFVSDFNSTRSGSYLVLNKQVSIGDDLTGSDFRRTAFHELFHALQGNRIVRNSQDTFGMKDRKIGLESPNRHRKALNEAVTDRLVDIFTDPVLYGQYSFNSESQQLFGTKPLSNSFIGSYQIQKAVYNNVFRQIGVKNIVAAYFKGDYDPLEGDNLAGTHAERELQREIKRAGGLKRIKGLRVIDQDFDKQNFDDAIAESFRVRTRDVVLSGLMHWFNARRVKLHTNRRNKQIATVKAIHKKRRTS